MLQNAAKVTKRNLVVVSTRHHHSRLLKYYPRPSCAPSFVQSRIFLPLQTHFLLFQQIFFVFVCMHPGTPRVRPRVLASGPKPCGAITFLTFSTNILCPCMYTPGAPRVPPRVLASGPKSCGGNHIHHKFQTSILNSFLTFRLLDFQKTANSL